MICEYGYYKEKDKFYPRLYCKIDDKWCPYVKKCEKKERFIANGFQEECYKRMEQRKKNIPKGSYYVNFERKGYLYIDIDDNHTIKVKNTIENFNQNYVYMQDDIDGYKLSATPFNQKKTNYTRKKPNEESKN